MGLTIRAVENAMYRGDGKSRCFLWDSMPVGFGLRIYPSGKKSFVISYRFRGKKRLMTVGPYGTLTLAEARSRARIHLVNVIDGIDVLEVRKKHRRPARS